VNAERRPGPGTIAEDSSMAPLRIASFRRLWVALVIFNLGHLIQVVASSWLILELTASPFWVSLMIAAPTLPLLVLSLPAGAAADLLDRRHVLIASSAVLCTASTGMSLLWGFDLITPGRLVALGLAIGVGVAFFNPAWQAIVPSLVPSSLVPGAVSLNSATGGVATALGPAAGGLLVATVGPGWSFMVATAGYSAVLVTMLVSQTADWNRDRAPIGVAIATGLRYLRFSKDYVWLLFLGSLFGFAAAALRSMLPNITSDVLGGDSTLYGVLLGLFGAGALVGGLTRSKARHVVGRKVVRTSIVVFGAFSTIVGRSSILAVTAVAIALAGLLWTWILSTLISTFQMLTPDWVRGRTMGAFILSVFGFVPLGSVAAGSLGATVGADSSLIVFSVVAVSLKNAAFRMPLPVLEDIRPPIMAEPTENEAPHADGSQSPVMVTNTWSIDESEFDSFVRFLAELRLLRLKTGAYHWAAYRSATDLSRISEVFMLHSWEQHLQQHRRLDLEGLDVIGRMDQFGGRAGLIRDHLVAFDVDHPRRRPAWRDLLAEHEEFHLPHVVDPDE
jgi:MFS family permease